jgi:hypothetical protein
MANSIATGLANDAIAEKSLEALALDLTYMREAITFRPTNKQVKKGQNIVCSVPSAVSAQSFGSSGYANADQTLSLKYAQMNKHKFVAYGIKDGERDSSLVNLVDSFAQANAHALASEIANDCLFGSGGHTIRMYSQGTYANGTIPSTQKLDITEANFGLDSMIEIGKVMDEAGIPRLGRWAWLTPSYHAKLEQEVIQIGNSSIDVNQTYSEGRLGTVRGFKVYSCPGLRTPDFLDQASVVCGVGDSLLIATAVPAMPEVSDGGEISYVTEPNSGLTVQKRVNYDYENASLNTVLTLYYGGGVLRPETLVTVKNQ